MNGKWFCHDTGRDVEAVAPGKILAPRIGSRKKEVLPDEVEVVRTFEPLLEKARIRAGLGLQRRPRTTLEMAQVAQSGATTTAFYEGWPASLLEPREQGTRWLFRSRAGGLRSPEVHVLAGVGIRSARAREQELKVGAVKLPLHLRLMGKRTRELTARIEAPVDPVVQLYPFSPHYRLPGGEENGPASLDDYVARTLSEMVADLGEAEELADPGIIEAAFYDEFGKHVSGEGEVSAQLSETMVEVGPESPRQVKIHLEAERDGPSLFALAARQETDFGPLWSVSDLWALDVVTGPAAATADGGPVHA